MAAVWPHSCLPKLCGLNAFSSVQPGGCTGRSMGSREEFPQHIVLMCAISDDRKDCGEEKLGQGLGTTLLHGIGRPLRETGTTE